MGLRDFLPYIIVSSSAGIAATIVVTGPASDPVAPFEAQVTADVGSDFQRTIDQLPIETVGTVIETNADLVASSANTFAAPAANFLLDWQAASADQTDGRGHDSALDQEGEAIRTAGEHVSRAGRPATYPPLGQLPATILPLGSLAPAMIGNEDVATEPIETQGRIISDVPPDMTPPPSTPPSNTPPASIPPPDAGLGDQIESESPPGSDQTPNTIGGDGGPGTQLPVPSIPPVIPTGIGGLMTPPDMPLPSLPGSTPDANSPSADESGPGNPVTNQPPDARPPNTTIDSEPNTPIGRGGNDDPPDSPIDPVEPATPVGPPPVNGLPQGTLIATPPPPASPPIPTPTSNGRFFVQVAATPFEDSLCELWATLRAELPHLMAGTERSIRQVKTPDGSLMFRLRIGAFAERPEAGDFCDLLKSEGHSCFVVQH
ncbi:MAG: SPOR domain-containing protein [Pseudomonadota bacterium]